MFLFRPAIEIDKSELHLGEFGFVNPLLECYIQEGVAFEELVPFKSKIEDAVNKMVVGRKVKSISVYFRDLNNGPWFGIDEKTDFFPGSLLKIPLLMSYLKAAETDPSIMKKTLSIKRKDHEDFTYTVPPSKKIEIGMKYTIEDLLTRMIVYSDNYATEILLLNNIGKVRDDVYSDLGISVPDLQKPYSITVKRYASFFRILFNASYLSKESSNKALELLSRSEFKSGIAAGVPTGVTVANKFGERFDNDWKQFHDCGIIYYPKHPYLLCIMSRGNDVDNLISSIKEISSVVYKEIDQQARDNDNAPSK